MKTRQTAFSIASLTGKLLLVLLFPMLMQAQSDTLKYRVTYYPTWAYDELKPWQIDFGGLTHIVIFTNGSISTTSPYWRPVVSSADSIDIEFGSNWNSTWTGDPSHKYLDSTVAICHRKGIKVLATIQCVNDGNFTYIASDSTRTQVFHNTLKAWMIRKHIDGWDLDLEGSSATSAQQVRFMRIGRRVGYDAAFPNGRAILGIASSRGNEYVWPAAQVDSMITFYDMQGYVYQWMWSPNANANVTWFQTPVASPASCANCQNSSLDYDALYGYTSFIDGWVASGGHDRSKVVLGYSTSLVTGFTGTNQLSAVWSGSFSDRSLVDVEAMVNYGGVWTHNATAKASYIAGTATAGNPLGLSAGTKFFLPFEDSTDIKAGIDYLKSKGYGGVMFYDIYGDRRIGATPNWKKTPYIYAGSVYAAKLNGGAAPIIGTLTVTPQTLPPSGGTVTLRWTSQNATSASIDQGIGTVITNSSKTISMIPTKTFCLTLSNGTTSVNYSVEVKSDNSLPVQLTSFVGSVNGHKVELAWKTATEVNSSTFEIERRDLAQWKKIGELPAAGTSNTLHEYSYVDNLNYSGPGNILYRLKTVNNDDSFEYSAEVEVAPLPIAFSLEQNYPNPFNPSTVIGYQLSVVGNVRLSVYDMLGREITTLVDGEKEAGYYSETLDGSKLSSGTYFARLTVTPINGKQMVQVKKILLAK